MAQTLVARRYAKAFLSNYATDLARAGKIADGLHALADVFADRKARRLLTSPAMPREIKLFTFKQLIESHQIDPAIIPFIELLVDAGRVILLPTISAVFRELLDQKLEIFDVQVISAVEMDPSVLAGLEGELKKKTGRKPRFDVRIDPSLLSGFVLRMGHNVIDLSSKARLDALTKTITF